MCVEINTFTVFIEMSLKKKTEVKRLFCAPSIKSAGELQGFDSMQSPGRVARTFSACASSDFRLLVTVFNSSSSSEHLLVF